MGRKEFFPVVEQDGSVEQTEDLIARIIEDNIELGCGKSACVFKLEGSDICVKRVKDVVLLEDRPVNSMRMELGFQEDAVRAGINSPMPIRSHTDKEGREYLLMKAIEGSSLKDVIEKKIKLPESYDHKEFWSKLDEMVKSLHDVGVYHRDLHWGNIMLEWESGLPVIIDYGHAGRKYFDDSDPYEKENFPKPGVTTHFETDEKRMKSVKEALEDYLTH